MFEVDDRVAWVCFVVWGVVPFSLDRPGRGEGGGGVVHGPVLLFQRRGDCGNCVRSNVCWLVLLTRASRGQRRT